ncbi:structure-specific endonuclease subunit SLX1 isoform X2 [Salvia hispanica]|uniref:structure-specific endonuclease subunit SLX1 isoform X2 n=1 Tax=Salvia hispanica TaxID=49212 RepID=UPI002009D4BD|nr:structure-specific endonuclease subunit SLX1 isoform X2 [Salvia hispanica]
MSVSPIISLAGIKFSSLLSHCLKQHNGELIGGAKASTAGRPWTCACLIQGFADKSKAYQFEAKWKSISKKLPRKRSGKNQEQAENSQHLLLQHRYAALNQVKDFINCSELEISWHLDPT